MSDRLQRTRDGVCGPIPPTEFMAWKAATDKIVSAQEYAILGEMDLAYCGEMNKEIAAIEARQTDAPPPPRSKRR